MGKDKLASLLILAYGWLKLKRLPIGEIVGGISDDIIIKIALSIYYLSWVSGTMNDIDEQETAYAKVPDQGRIQWHGVAICIIVAAVFAILCFVNSAKLFGVCLAGFLVVNLGAYWYLVQVVSDMMAKSHEEYIKDGDLQSNLKLVIVENYLLGKWQRCRFIYGFTVVGMIIAMCYSKLPLTLNAIYHAIPPDSYIALSILFYVITFEGWIWIMRIWSRQAQRTVDFVFKDLQERNGSGMERYFPPPANGIRRACYPASA